jgi:hypothetical protein
MPLPLPHTLELVERINWQLVWDIGVLDGVTIS